MPPMSLDQLSTIWADLLASRHRIRAAGIDTTNINNPAHADIVDSVGCWVEESRYSCSIVFPLRFEGDLIPSKLAISGLTFDMTRFLALVACEPEYKELGFIDMLEHKKHPWVHSQTLPVYYWYAYTKSV